MNEEEKQAIDWLKEELDDEKKSCKNCNYSYKGVTGLYGNNEVEIALKLIEKQQKEIEELGNRKAENYYHWKHLEAKIINKMKELEEMPENQYIHLHYIKKMLRELLGE